MVGGVPSLSQLRPQLPPTQEGLPWLPAPSRGCMGWREGDRALSLPRGAGRGRCLPGCGQLAGCADRGRMMEEVSSGSRKRGAGECRSSWDWDMFTPGSSLCSPCQSGVSWVGMGLHGPGLPRCEVRGCPGWVGRGVAHRDRGVWPWVQVPAAGPMGDGEGHAKVSAAFCVSEGLMDCRTLNIYGNWTLPARGTVRSECHTGHLNGRQPCLAPQASP